MDMFMLFFSGLIASLFTNGRSLIHELSILACAALAIFRDEVLSSHLGLVLYACFGFLLTCHLLILSRAVLLRPKSWAGDKPVIQLRDTDFESEDERQVESSCQEIFIDQFFKNAYEFCKFRPVYGILMIVGFIFFIIFCAIRIIALGDKSLTADLHRAASALFEPWLFLIGVPLIIANVGLYVSDDEIDLYSYRPFQEVVKVPLKVMVGKTLADFLTFACRSIYVVLSLFGFMVFVFSSLVFMYHMTEADAERMKTDYGMRVILFKDIRKLIVTLLASTAVGGFFYLSNILSSSWRRARRSVFGVLEMSWRRNLRAIEYLLQVAEVTSLEDLEAALYAKRTEQLTDGEKRAFNYVDWPLWQTKRPFVGERIIMAEQDVEPDNEVVEVPAQQENAESTERDGQAAEAAPEDQPAMAEDQKQPVEQAAVAGSCEYRLPVLREQRKPGGGPVRPQRKTSKRYSGGYQDFINETSSDDDLQERDQQAAMSMSLNPTPAEEQLGLRRSKRLKFLSQFMQSPTVNIAKNEKVNPM